MKEKKLLSKYKEKDRYIKVTLEKKKKKKGEEDGKGKSISTLLKSQSYKKIWSMNTLLSNIEFKFFKLIIFFFIQIPSLNIVHQSQRLFLMNFRHL